MSSDVRLPAEVLSFLSKTRKSLLIKGEAGTGKTILSLELLRHFSRKGDGIYISTRVSPQSLYEQIPYLKEIVKPDHVLESLRAKVVFKHVTMIMDLRVSDAPAITKELYYKARELEEPFIIIDSWDGIAKRLPPVERAKNEDILVKMAEETNARIIFVSEEPEQTTLDYLVDGIVTLLDGYLSDRRIREIELNKLRGTRIGKKRHVFTLEGGKFRSFDPFMAKNPKKYSRVPDPMPDPDEAHVSSGIKDFDRLLGGGYLKGSLNLFEIAGEVGSSYNQMINPTIVNHLNLERHIVSIQPLGSTSKEFDSDVKRYLKYPERLEGHLASFEQIGGRAPHAKRLNSSMEEALGQCETTIRRMIQENSAPLMLILGLDTLEFAYGMKENRKRIGEMVSMIKEFSAIGLATVNEGQEVQEEAGNLATTRWRITTRNGEILVYGVTPRTELYAMETDVSRGYPEVELIPIV